MDKKQLDDFVGNWIEKWCSSCVDVKVRVQNFVHPMEITVTVYDAHVSNTLCETHFNVGNDFQYRCFTRCMDRILMSYCKSYRETKLTLHDIGRFRTNFSD